MKNCQLCGDSKSILCPDCEGSSSSQDMRAMIPDPAAHEGHAIGTNTFFCLTCEGKHYIPCPACQP
jgi:hypothetical protein